MADADVDVELRRLQNALASAKAGVGHSSEQVFAWMEAWVEGNKRPLPAPDVTSLKAKT